LIASELKLPQRKRIPDDLDDSKGPGADQEAVRAGQQTAECKGQCEAAMASLERIHRHHETQRQDAEYRYLIHSTLPSLSIRAPRLP
jgi:hypothetical protein